MFYISAIRPCRLSVGLLICHNSEECSASFALKRPKKRLSSLGADSVLSSQNMDILSYWDFSCCPYTVIEHHPEHLVLSGFALQSV